MQEQSNYDMINRLFASFEDLERAISGAKQSIEAKPMVPSEVLKRLDSYFGILKRQRELAGSLSDHVKSGNTLEISRLVGLINSLSNMIIEDAKDILQSLSLPGEEGGRLAKEEINFC